MQGSLVLSLLTVLLAAANGQYSCSNCTVSETQANCPVQNCTVGTCILTLETVFLGNNVTVNAYMENNTTCHAEFISLSVGPDKQVRTSSMCFQSNFNQNITVAVPPKSSRKNGLQCAACESPDADQCKKNVNIPCTGSQDRCIDLAGTLVNSNTTLVLKGCATQSACKLKVNSSFYYSQKTYTLTKASCLQLTSKGSNVAVHALAFFPTLAGLLLVKQLS
ncbi:phospholipase A2 inhibitor and Ly6/PLAUR domain-containing protein-like [Trachemys scripta elegans]|uniref:phospholipase A2 inhibitor and Ly6/PLAUR domain-containing protein-like n=1 Tax=Trachemys scripta elegans TaxID=31138 RepID=UPI001552FC15|nr:phospholipase A2 inhibitor and Ly6/PLAUR domain-containing protein-like [Trachemys scripta elegans]XP_034612613.1 phospholipase A2 inhibitor and Ly6/PLAUR domain-containing protein-like [Trachemys scripta elegans]XP_034612614.1 phospholipase A2 inhibitor and Ly6/PLAUR domain-containing protein-like [Trachemys scripta elegans]